MRGDQRQVGEQTGDAVQGDRAVAEATTDMLIKVESGRKESKSDVVRNEVTWRLKRGPLGWKIQEEIFR